MQMNLLPRLDWPLLDNILFSVSYFAIAPCIITPLRAPFNTLFYSILSSFFIAPCTSGTLQCPISKACYLPHAVCDSYDDCGTGFEEMNCPKLGKFTIASKCQNLFLICRLIIIFLNVWLGNVRQQITFTYLFSCLPLTYTRSERKVHICVHMLQ